MGSYRGQGSESSAADDGVATLYSRHYRDLVRLAIRLVDSAEAAEEAVQDVFANVSARHDALPRLAYLRTAVVNHCRSSLRRQQVRRRWAAAQPPVQYSSDHSDELTDQHLIRGIVRGLPSRQREVVVLRYYEDLPIKEIAETLGISENATSVALSHALKAITTKLEKTS